MHTNVFNRLTDSLTSAHMTHLGLGTEWKNVQLEQVHPTKLLGAIVATFALSIDPLSCLPDACLPACLVRRLIHSQDRSVLGVSVGLLTLVGASVFCCPVPVPGTCTVQRSAVEFCTGRDLPVRSLILARSTDRPLGSHPWQTPSSVDSKIKKLRTVAVPCALPWTHTCTRIISTWHQDDGRFLSFRPGCHGSGELVSLPESFPDGFYSSIRRGDRKRHLLSGTKRRNR